jgi:Phosphotransferase enzyme family
MSNINWIYFDDSAGALERYGKWITDAWLDLDLGIDFKIEPIDDFDKAKEMIREESTYWHILISDIIEQEKKEASGLHLIESARTKNPRMAIIGLSIAAEYREKAKRKGADDFILKSDLTDEIGMQQLGARLSGILKEKYQELFVLRSTLHYDDDNFALSAIIETIGDENVKDLAQQFSKRKIDAINVFYVSPGLSGAYVLHLKCSLTQIDAKEKKIINVLLKASKDKLQLAKEVEQYEFAKHLSHDIFVPIREKKIASCRAWHAIAYDFREQSLTFLDWILQKDRLQAKDIKRTLDMLFLSPGLQDDYKDMKEMLDVRPNVALYSKLMTKWRRAFMIYALKEFVPIIKKNESLEGFDEKQVETFIRSARILELDENTIPKGTFECRRVHGDLHSRNVLVDRHGSPKLIDPANIDECHWAADLARLMVDLFISGYDSGVESYLWNNLVNWKDTCVSIINFDLGVPRKINSYNSRILAAIGTLIGYLPRIFNGIWQDRIWEFQLALAIEFLRASYRQEVSVPKRVLGLVAGCYALQITYDTFKTNNKLGSTRQIYGQRPFVKK